MSSPNWIVRSLIILLTFTLAGAPEVLAAQQTPAAQDQQQNPTEQPIPAASDPQAEPVPPTSDAQAQPAPQTEQNVGTSQESATPDPSKGPLKPNDTQTLPNAPSSTQAHQSPGGRNQQPKEAPSGAAAAQAGKTTGGAASRPAGIAIAPAKQRQTRSLLIKIGFIVAAAGAAGIVYGLSRSTPSTPPGAAATTTTSAVH